MVTTRSLRPGEYRRLSELCAREKRLAHLPDCFMPVLQTAGCGLPGDGWALERDGALVGYAGYVMAEAAPELWRIGVLVLPEQRRRGIGGEALRLLAERLRRRGARRLLAGVYSDQRAGLGWLASHGSREVARSHQLQLDLAEADGGGRQDEVVGALKLDLAAADRSDRQGLDELLLGQGLHLMRLDQFPRHGLAERLLPIWNRTRPDQPQLWPFVPYDARRLGREMLEPDELALPFSYVVVAEPRQIVALALNAYAGDAGLCTVYLAIDADFRGRGLAIALKRRLIADARAGGIGRLYAENDRRSGAMLAINRRLGYRHFLDLLVYERTLA